MGAVVWLIVVPLMFLRGALPAGWGFGLGDPAAATATFTGASWLGAAAPTHCVERSGGGNDCPGG